MTSTNNVPFSIMAFLQSYEAKQLVPKLQASYLSDYAPDSDGHVALKMGGFYSRDEVRVILEDLQLVQDACDVWRGQLTEAQDNAARELRAKKPRVMQRKRAGTFPMPTLRATQWCMEVQDAIKALGNVSDAAKCAFYDLAGYSN